MENQKYIDIKTLCILTDTELRDSNSYRGDLIEIPEEPKNLVQIFNMEEYEDSYIYNGKIISNFELQVMYDLIFMSKIELFNKLLGR